MKIERTRQHDPRDGWYVITPSIAQFLLDSQPHNRPLREIKAQRFAEQITERQWMPNGEPIILDENGMLLDGQGRCRAVCIAGKPIETYVIHGIPRKFFPSVDIGQNRSGADTLALMGAKNYAVVSAVCRLGALSLRGELHSSTATVTNTEINSFYKLNATVINNAMETIGHWFKKAPLPPSILLFVYLEASKVDQDKAFEFIRGVVTGELLPNSSPMLALRQRMQVIRGRPMRSHEKLALTIKAWNSFLLGRKTSVLRWQRSGEEKSPEKFPSFVTEIELTI